MLRSSKEIGRFEGPLVECLKHYFEQEGYSVSTHTRLNIAWSNVISDIDILAKSDETIIITEVKSDHDDFYKGFEQLEKLKGFADILYIATNRKPENLLFDKWRDETIGLLYVSNRNVEIVKPAKKIYSLCSKDTLSQLKRKCLVRLVRLLNIPTYFSKKELEKKLRAKFNSKDLKIIAKSIALCDNDCENNCVLEPFLVAVCNNLKPVEKKL